MLLTMTWISQSLSIQGFLHGNVQDLVFSRFIDKIYVEGTVTQLVYSYGLLYPLLLLLDYIYL